MQLRVLFYAVLLSLSACGASPPIVINGQTMGTTYSVKYVTATQTLQLQEKIDAELSRVNALMSTYIKDSELSKFNQSPINQPFTMSSENIFVFKRALEIYKLSQGKFDITIGPLVNLWGFGPNFEAQVIPTEEQIQAARALVDMRFIKIGDNTLSKTAAVYADLSAIAKGYGVDQVAKLLEREGITNYLVEIGGELRAKGVNHRGALWRIAIEQPDVYQRVPFTAIDLDNMAMATSGDYRNYFEVDGKRYSHTIDPTTGKPIIHNVASVTVIAKDAMMADGFATAIDVMGAEAGLKLAEAQNIAVLLIIKTEDGFVSQHSSKFEAYLANGGE